MKDSDDEDVSNVDIDKQIEQIFNSKKSVKETMVGAQEGADSKFSILHSTLKGYGANFAFQRAKSAETTSKSWNWPRKWQKKSMPERYFQNLTHYFVTNNTSGC